MCPCCTTHPATVRGAACLLLRGGRNVCCAYLPHAIRLPAVLGFRGGAATGTACFLQSPARRWPMPCVACSRNVRREAVPARPARGSRAAVLASSFRRG